MSNTKELNQDFYIGWQEKAPEAFAKRTKGFVWRIAGLVVIVAALIVVFQKPLAGSVFEFGTISTVEGVLRMYPAPMLKTSDAGESEGILLVGFGKIGAEVTIEKMEENRGIKLDGMLVTLKGTKIYHDGKTALELTEGLDAFVEAKEASSVTEVTENVIGEVTLKGEILDPKCALGVMIPAEGKPHRSCAIRCISGGIPPLLRIKNQEGESNYILLRSREKNTVNQEVLPYVADQIAICGKLVQEDDWLVLYTDPTTNIQRLLPYGAPESIPFCGK